MEITDIHFITPPDKPGSTLLAWTDVTLDFVITVYGVPIFRTRKGKIVVRWPELKHIRGCGSIKIQDDDLDQEIRESIRLAYEAQTIPPFG